MTTNNPLNANATGIQAYDGSGNFNGRSIAVSGGGASISNANGVSGNPTITLPAQAIQADWTQSNGSSLDYIKNKPSIPASQIQSDWTQSNSVLVDYIKNKPTIPSAQIQSDWTQASTGALDYIKNKPSIPGSQVQSDWTQASTSAVDYIKNKPAIRSQSAATRSLNTIFQVSASRWALVRYSIDISTTVSLSGSQIGSVILEMATNAAFTTGVQTLQSFSNGNSGTLVIGLVLTQLNTACLSGDVPAGNYVRLRTVNITGVPTFTYQVGQEILI